MSIKRDISGTVVLNPPKTSAYFHAAGIKFDNPLAAFGAPQASDRIGNTGRLDLAGQQHKHQKDANAFAEGKYRPGPSEFRLLTAQNEPPLKTTAALKHIKPASEASRKGGRVLIVV